MYALMTFRAGILRSEGSFRMCGLITVMISLFLLPMCLSASPEGMGECTPCIIAASQGSRIVNTLVYFTQKPVECKQDGTTCLNQDKMYHICESESEGYLCYKPEIPVRFNVTLWAGMPKTKEPRRDNPEGGGILFYINSTVVLQHSIRRAVIWFNACDALSKGLGTRCGSKTWAATYRDSHKYLCYPHEGARAGNPEVWAPCGSNKLCSGWGCVCAYTAGGYPGCPHLSQFRRIGGNRISFVIDHSHPPIQVYGFGINGPGKDPVTYLTITRTEIRDGEKKSHSWSVENVVEKLKDGSPYEISQQAKNLFLEMAQSIATELGVSNCYVCGGTNYGEDWPWEAMEISPQLYNNMSKIGNVTRRTQSQNMTWTITSHLVGRVCFSQNGTIPVGYLTCIGTWESGVWYSPSHAPQPEKFNATFLPFLYSASLEQWKAPLNMYWICGNMAYEYLPHSWSGSCVLAFIKPSFFLVPIQTQQFLAAPVYGPLNRRKRDDTPFAGFSCKNPEEYEGDIWDSQRIVCVYGPATWAQDGSWGYRTPIYMLNRIIRLQAVLDLAGQRITTALTAIAEVTDQLRTAVYQNRLALDYLLASENGVCGKFNLTNCCLKIDPVGKVVTQLATEIKQLTLNPTQEWKGMQWQWLNDFMPQTWMKTLASLLIAPLCLLLFALICIPCLLRFVQSTVSKVVEKVTGPKLIAVLQDYEALRMDDSE